MSLLVTHTTRWWQGLLEAAVHSRTLPIDRVTCKTFYFSHSLAHWQAFYFIFPVFSLLVAAMCLLTWYSLAWSLEDSSLVAMAWNK